MTMKNYFQYYEPPKPPKIDYIAEAEKKKWM